MKNLIEKIKNIFLDLPKKILNIIQIFLATSIPLYSSNAAFFLIISSIPIFMLIFSTISMVPNVKVEDLIVNINLIFPNLPYVRNVLEYITEVARGLASTNVVSLNLLTALITGSTALYSFIIGIRKIHNITRKSSFISLRILAIFSMFVFFLAIILMLLFFIMGSMILGYVKEYLPFAVSFIDKLLNYRYLVAFIVLLVLMMSLYATSTNFERKLKHNIVGATFSTFAWLIISNVFSFYFKYFPLNANVYGSLAGIVVVLLWLYACMNIIFLGAIINEIYYPEKRILEELKKQIMEELEKGNDTEVDKILAERLNSTKIKQMKRPDLK